MVVNRAAADLARGRPLRFDNAPIAIDERLRRGFVAQVGSHPSLPRALEWARITGRAPDWVGPRQADAWLLIGYGVAIPPVWQRDELIPTVVLSRDKVVRVRRARAAARRRRR